MNKGLKNRMVMVRLTDSQADELTRLAGISKQKVTAIIREMIDFGLKNVHKPKASRLEKTQLQAIYEAVFILRGLAERVEPSMAEEASKQAQRVIAQHFDAN